jgi:peptidoglycan/xylan/chitin deacetylase (PgdA/CDA1 family)
MTEESFCSELRRSAQAFQSMTGQPMVPLWRAPGGHTSPKTLAWAEQCGFKHGLGAGRFSRRRTVFRTLL